ncbi:MFS transporter [Rhodococcus sp. ABRD24]|nr:MFS transporter [Rhodococcus sp. ABRD24]
MRWIVLIGSFIAYIFDALEVVILSIALPDIREDLGLSATQGGLMATATLLGIGASSITAGWFADNYGRKKPLLYCLLIFGAFTAAIAFIGNFWIIMLLRFISGFGLGGVWGIVSAYIVETWPAHRRGRAVAFVLSAFPIGGVLAALLARLVLPDWRLLFFISGVGVVIPLAIVAFGFKESAEWQTARRNSTDETATVSVARIFKPDLRRTTLIGTAVCSLSLVAWWGSSTWLPTFLHEDKGVPMTTVTLLLTLLNVGMFLGYNIFGIIADKYGRKLAIIISLAGTGLTLPLYVLAGDEQSLYWLGPLFAFFVAFFGLYGSYLSEIFPTEVRTTGAGFCFNIGRGVSALAPLILGFIAGGVGLSTGLLVCASLFIVAAAMMTLMPDSNRRPKEQHQHSDREPTVSL